MMTVNRGKKVNEICRFLWWITVCVTNMNLDKEQNIINQVILSLSKTPLSFACSLEGHVFDHVIRTTQGFQNDKL